LYYDPPIRLGQLMIYAPLYGAHMAMYPVYWMQGVYASAQGGGI